MQLFLGDWVTIRKNESYISGRVNGLKMNKGELERLSFEEVNGWFSMKDGWLFVIEMEEDENDVD